MQKKWLPLLLVICFCSVFLISCGPPVTNIDVGCSSPELIDAINTANATPGTAASIHLSPGCIYEFDVIETYDRRSAAGVALPEITSQITIDGQNATISRSSSSGTPEFRLLYVGETGNLILTMITLTGGKLDESHGDGGAILNSGQLTIINSIFNENRAGFGGAIFSIGDELDIVGSTFEGNMSDSWGGAIDIHNTSSVISSTFQNNSAMMGGGAISNRWVFTNVEECSFISNTATFGGAIFNESVEDDYPGIGKMYVWDNQFENNSADEGGAIYNADWSQIWIKEGNFSNNAAASGGAIYNEEELVLGTSSFSNNQAENYGGAVYSRVSDLGTSTHSMGFGIINSTFSGNQITSGYSNGGSAIYILDGGVGIKFTTITENTGAKALVVDDDHIVIKNSIVANNSDGDCGGVPGVSILPEGLPNLDSDGSCGFSLTDDPDLYPLADNGGSTLTHKPHLYSPVIDAAVDEVFSYDQIDQTRPIGAGKDLGAFELQDVIPSVRYPEPTLRVIETIPVPLVDDPPDSPLPDINWQFEGFVCSDIGLTEFYMRTTASAEEFHITINEKDTACYQQSYDQERYWCHIEKQSIGWEVPVEIVYCLGKHCTSTKRTTLSESRCASPDAPSEPEAPDEPQQIVCSSFTTKQDCSQAGCVFDCQQTPNGSICQCENN